MGVVHEDRGYHFFCRECDASPAVRYIAQVYRIARDDDDDDETSTKKIAAMLGPTQTKDIAPLLFKLVMLEQGAG